MGVYVFFFLLEGAFGEMLKYRLLFTGGILVCSTLIYYKLSNV